MIESFSDANEELKRVDHLIFVSLKYTRTVDVIINILKRIIDCIDFLIDTHLKFALEKKLIDEEIPKNKAIKAELLKKTFSDSKKVVEMGNFYLWLRKVVRAKVSKINEFKRHVGLVTEIKNKENNLERILVDIDVLEELYKTKLKEFMEMTSELIKDGPK